MENNTICFRNAFIQILSQIPNLSTQINSLELEVDHNVQIDILADQIEKMVENPEVKTR